MIFRQFKYDDDYEFVDEDRSKINEDEYEGGFISRSFNDPIAKRMNKFSKLSEYTRPHFRPTEQSTSSTTPNTISSTLSSTSTSATTLVMRTSPSIPTSTASTVTSTEEVQTQTSATSIFSKFSKTTAKIADSDLALNSTTTTMASPSITMAQIVKEQNFSINEIPGQNDRIDEDLEEPETEAIAYSEKTMIKEDTTLELAGTTTSVPTESLVNQKEEEEEEEVLSVVTKTTIHEELIAAASQEQPQQFRPRPEYRPSGVAESLNTGGQLYQDVAKDQQEQSVLKLRGV